MRKTLRLMLILTLAGSGAVLISPYFAAHSSDNAVSTEPRLEVVESIDLGHRQMDQVAEASFTLTNTGSGILSILDVHADCGCAGVYMRATNGSKAAVKSLRLPPGVGVQAGVDLLVRGTLGVESIKSIRLRTNEARFEHRAINIRVIPSANTYAVPNTLPFGDVLVGSLQRQSIVIKSHRTIARLSERKLTTDKSDQFQVEFDPTNDASQDRATTDGGPPTLAKLRLHLLTERPSSVNSPVLIYCDGEELARVHVTARIVPVFEFLPEPVLLPLRAGDGDSYECRLWCKCNNGDSFRLQQVDSVSDLTLAYNDEAYKPLHSLHMKYTGVRPTALEKRLELRFRATVIDAGQVEITLPVHVRQSRETGTR